MFNRLALIEFVNTFVNAWLAKVKARIALSIITFSVFLIFAVVGIIFLFMLAFTSLEDAYDPSRACLIMFAFCAFVCAGALLAHYLGMKSLKKSEAKVLLTKAESNVSKDQKTLSKDLSELIRGSIESRQYSVMLGAVIIGSLVGFRPKAAASMIRIASRLLPRR